MRPSPAAPDPAPHMRAPQAACTACAPGLGVAACLPWALGVGPGRVVPEPVVALVRKSGAAALCRADRES